MKPFEFLEHTADVKMRVRGASLKELYQNALTGMNAVIEPHKEIRPVSAAFSLNSNAPEELLIAFLNEVLAEMDVQKACFDCITSWDFSDNCLMCRLSGFEISGSGSQIKAATYHECAVTTDKREWKAEIVFDA